MNYLTALVIVFLAFPLTTWYRIPDKYIDRELTPVKLIPQASATPVQVSMAPIASSGYSLVPQSTVDQVLPFTLHERIGMRFTENRGQVADTSGRLRPDVLYTADAGGAQLFFTRTGVRSVFVGCEQDQREISEATGRRRYGNDEPAADIESLVARQIDMQLLGCNQDAVVDPDLETHEYQNFYLAHCPDGITGVRSYRRIVYRNIYNGIDLVYQAGAANQLKYEFVISPFADPRAIRMMYTGADVMIADVGGTLQILAGFARHTQEAPKTFTDDGEKVESTFRLDGNVVSFRVGDYDKSKTLVIDPWATYLGGTQSDVCSAVMTNAGGEVVATGATYSTNFPGTSGTAQTVNGGTRDIFVSKFSPYGILLWSTYYGGSNYEHGGFGMGAIDASGNIVIVTGTNSQNFPVSSGAYQSSNAGLYDAGIVKLTPAGLLSWATYYGGSGNESCQVTVDGNGDVFVTGGTTSANLPVDTSAFQPTFGGGSDAFLAKFGSGGNFLWATYYGGTGSDGASARIIDGNGNVIFAGSTNGSFPVSPGAFQSTLAGGLDGFIVKFSGSGARLWATYFGGSLDDLIYCAAADGNGNLLLAGITKSSDFPITSGAFQTSNAGGSTDGFIAKFDSNGVKIWATYCGGSGADEITSATADASGTTIIVGYTLSSNFPVTSGAYQQNNAGNSDACIAKFDAGGSLIWATYYGGSMDDMANGVSIDQNGNVLFGGLTSGSIPTHNPWQSQNANPPYFDAFLVSFNSNGNFIPVELSSFAALQSGNTISLYWRTEIETRNHGFEVQRSFTGKTEDWHLRGFITGAGTSTGPHFYSFVDEAPHSLEGGASIFYRLTQVDFDGTVHVSHAVEVFFAAHGPSISAPYPQPATRTASVLVSLDEEDRVSMHLIDAPGRTAALLLNDRTFAAGSHEVSFHWPDISPGVYFLSLTGTRTNLVRRLVIR